MYKIYKINYNNNLKIKQNGGDNQITFTPDYPDDIEQSRSADWPPSIGSSIIITDPSNNKKYTGSVEQNIWNDTASVIKLTNNDYIEISLKDDSKWNNGKGYFLLLPDYSWSSTDIKMTSVQKPSQHNLVQSKKLNLATNRDNESSNLNLKEYKNVLDKSNILSTKVANQIPENHQEVTKNDHYVPLLSDPKKNYFSDRKVDITLSNAKDNFTSLSSDKIQLLSNKLKSFENINDKDIKIIVNRNIAINNLISDPSDEINEGSKIIKWIDNVLKKEVFKDLIVKIHEGYVYITRRGVKVVDVITKDIVPNLSHFDWQENKPINYDTLKYVIFQNTFQKNIQDNISQKREAEEILSQEYIIALQPSPLYQLWALKKIVMIWYGDPIVEPHIRKVKILINQFRADPQKEYNKNNGLLGSIIVYPKYGVESAKIVLSKLDYYFSLYVDENTNPRYQDIQWNESKPSYFIKKNALIYYTNGSIDLKNYIKYSLGSNGTISNDILTNDYAELLESKKVMGV